MRMVIYARVSLDRDETSESPEQQIAGCRRLIESKGWTVADVLVDRNLSAYSGVHRPELQQALKGIETGVYEGLCVWELSRLVRRYTDYGPILRTLVANHAVLLSCTDSVDTTTPMGQAVVGILVAQAEGESQHTSVRQRRSEQARAERGELHSGGHRLFGYSRQREVVVEEAAVAVEVRKRLVEGASLYAVATWLNNEAVRTTAGNQWSGPSLMQWLGSPALAGYRTHRKPGLNSRGRPRPDERELTKGSWEPIFTPDEWREVNEIVRSRGRRNKVSRGPNHLLTGLLRCGRCGGRMKTMGFSMKNGQPFPRYQCVKQPGHANCGGVAITKTSLDAHVVDQMFRFLAKAKLRPMGRESDIADLRTQIDTDSTAKAELTMQRFVQRVLAEVDFRAAYDALDQRLQTNTALLGALEQEQRLREGALRPGRREDLEQWWAQATLLEQRAALAQTFRQITIHPAKQRGGNRFDTSRAELHWNWNAYLRAAEEFDATATPDQRAAAEDVYHRLGEEASDASLG